MAYQFILSEEQKDLFNKSDKLFNGLNVTAKLNRKRDGIYLTIEGNESELNLYIEILDSIGIN